jgi:hypothetical protein
LLQRYNQHARNVRQQYRPCSNGARNVGMDSGLNHVLTVETQLASVNDPVLHAARLQGTNKNHEQFQYAKI